MGVEETSQKYKLLVIELESAPYKVDLFNAFAVSGLFDIQVLFSREKDWAPDAGHDFQELSPFLFSSTVCHGGFGHDLLGTTSKFLSLLIQWRPDLVVISGYADAMPLCSIIFCVLSKIKYAIRSDMFNNGIPRGRGQYVKRCARNLIRKFIFKTALAVLTCGRKGRESALVAGCPERMIFDFPYVVDAERIQSDTPAQIPELCLKDTESGNVIILFSGRMIPRKGLSTLLESAAALDDITNWILWIEGDGPLLSSYVSQARGSGVEERCRFFGFCQMSLHSWLLRNCDIVVVPSLKDQWGIVVDEGMQLGKAVVTSDETGSGADRVLDDTNGLVFAAGNQCKLSDHLRTLISYPEKRLALGESAKLSSSRFGPKVNVRTITRLLQKERVNNVSES